MVLLLLTLKKETKTFFTSVDLKILKLTERRYSDCWEDANNEAEYCKEPNNHCYCHMSLSRSTVYMYVTDYIRIRYKTKRQISNKLISHYSFLPKTELRRTADILIKIKKNIPNENNVSPM